MRRYWLGALVILAACEMFAPKEDEPKSADDDDATAKSAKQAESAAPTAETTPASESVPQQAVSSSAPTLQEWDAVGEVTVKGSSALNCETKMLRDWFRASCRDKNDTGGRPTAVRVVSGRTRNTFEYASGDVISLVTPFVPGTHVEAVFSWTDRSHKLVLDWPKGAPKPQVLGVYEGAKSPLDKPAGDPKLLEAVCKCERKRNPKIACGTMMEDCAHTYALTDCDKYNRCANGDASVPPKCRPGHLMFALNQCFKPCKTNADCPAGSGGCAETMGDPPAKLCAP